MNLTALLTLLSAPNIGPVRARKLIEVFGSPEAVLAAGKTEIATVPGIGLKIAESFSQVEPNFAEQQLKETEKHGAKIVTYWDDDYPPYLKEIYDPPLALFVQGELECDGNPCLAVVGTRKYSQYGRNCTENIVAGLIQNGFTIVSGMARGIDGLAHQTALAEGGKTVAVLGCSLDVVYPIEHKKLKEQIAQNGAVISEFPFTTEPEGVNFPRRNRIISGLSRGTLIIEAGEKSGALITAAYALDQNREVFALPGDINRRQSEGCNQLIKTGKAALVTSAKDILDAFQIQLHLPLEVLNEVKEPELDGAQKKIYQALTLEPIYIDDLALAVQINPSDVLTILLDLEMSGYIKQVPGKRFIRA